MHVTAINIQSQPMNPLSTFLCTSGTSQQSGLHDNDMKHTLETEEEANHSPKKQKLDQNLLQRPEVAEHMHWKVGDSTKKEEELCMLPFYATSLHWQGLDTITDLIAFGDSTTCYSGCKTWLGHILSAVNNQRCKTRNPPLNASCYSVAGSTVEDDLEGQLEKFFEHYPKKKTPASKSPLDPNKSLYVLWLGTNDCGQADSPSDLEEIVDNLFANGLDELYVKAGARNFLLIDVPPNERSPAAINLSTDISKQYRTWNELLNEQAKLFAQESKNASVFLFSANAVISAILDAPDEYGFEEEDISEEGGPIWLDDMHLTSDVHAIIAEKLEKALHSVPCGST